MCDTATKTAVVVLSWKNDFYLRCFKVGLESGQGLSEYMHQCKDQTSIRCLLEVQSETHGFIETDF